MGQTETVSIRVPSKLKRKSSARDRHGPDRFFSWLVWVPGVMLVLLLLAIAAFLFWNARETIQHFGFSFLTGTDWDPVQQNFGALPAVFGTVVSSLIRISIAAPLSIGVALFLTEVASGRLGRIVGFLVEMLAAVPSVVYGIWGIFVLAPWLREKIQPALHGAFGFLPFFAKPFYGVGMFCAGVVLAIMIIPTIASIAREVFAVVPRGQREAALALGATKWEMMRLSVLKASKGGLAGAMILGLGRALGETMAVAMVIGNRLEISASIFSPSATMSSVIANEYAEAADRLHMAALVELGLILFFVTFVINAIARFFVMSSSKRRWS